MRVVICFILMLLMTTDVFSQVDEKNSQPLHERFSYRPGEPVQLASHRGATAAGFPENCIATFERTMKWNPVLFEIDPRLTKDSVIVVMHDATLNRTTNGKGKLADHSWAEISQLRLRDPLGNITDFKVPTLDDLLKWAKGKTILMIDKKDVPLPLLWKKIKEHDAASYVIISSYKVEEAVYYQKQNKDLYFEAFIRNEKELNQYDSAQIPVRNRFAYTGKPANFPFYKKLHEKGMKVMVYTAKSTEQLPDPRKRYEVYQEIAANGGDIILCDNIEEVATALYPEKYGKYSHHIRIPAQQFFQSKEIQLPIVSGHRGTHIPGVPENSIEAMEYVLQHTPAFFEIDPRITKDSVIVLHHDATLDRTTTGTGKLSDYTWEELKKLRLKDSEGKPTSHRIPTLEEAVGWARGKTILNLDKKDVPFEMTDAIIKRLNAGSFVMVTVHNAEQALYYYTKDTTRMMSAFVRKPEAIAEYEAAGIPWKNVIAYVGPDTSATARIIIDELKKRGVKCMISAASTYDKLPNKEDRIKSYQQIFRFGAEIIESDYPVDVR